MMLLFCYALFIINEFCFWQCSGALLLGGGVYTLLDRIFPLTSSMAM